MKKSTDEIRIIGLKLYAYHGCLEEEKEKGQEFTIDITFHLSLLPAGLTDNLDKTINYAEACEYTCEVFSKYKYNLIETAAEDVANALLLKYELADSVDVTVYKPHAPIMHDFENVCVSVSRTRHIAYIAVGSNLGESKDTIEKAKEMFCKLEGNEILKEATLISTKPYGVTDQPDFLNGMIVVRTLLEPHELLDRLHKVESYEKRERTMRWGPRTLDLDIIYYDDLVMGDDELIIPHEDMQNRDFVLKPLLEIAPGKRHPITGDTPEMMLKKLHA